MSGNVVTVEDAEAVVRHYGIKDLVELLASVTNRGYVDAYQIAACHEVARRLESLEP